MIITQTRQRRTFVGSLNAGAGVIDSLAAICVDNGILLATFSGIGYVTNPVIRSYNLSRRGFDRPITHDGLLHVVSCHGNASLKEEQTVLRTHVIGTLHRDHEEPKLVSGELVEGEVVSFEFTLASVDDIRLFRGEDDRTGLDPWLHMSLGETPPTIASITPPALEDEGPEVDSPPEDDEPSVEVREGDWIEHPTLGRCEVVSSDNDERASIRLESGRVVELHLGLLELRPPRTDEDGITIIPVHIRRRR